MDNKTTLKLNTYNPTVILPDGSTKKFDDVISAIDWCSKNGIECGLSY